MKFKIFFFCCVFLNLQTCTFSHSSNFELEITNEVNSVLSSWGFQTRVNVDQNSLDKIVININFLKIKNDTLESYFLDSRSNELITRLLLIEIYESIKTIDKVDVFMYFDGYPKEITMVSASRTQLKNAREDLNDSFRYLAISAIKTFRYDGIIMLDALINRISEKKILFKKKGSFWDLLYGYSLACQFPQDYLCESYSFIVFVLLVSDDENDLLTDVQKHTLINWQKECDVFIHKNYDNIKHLISRFQEKYNYDIKKECLT